LQQRASAERLRDFPIEHGGRLTGQPQSAANHNAPRVVEDREADVPDGLVVPAELALPGQLAEADLAAVVPMIESIESV
jgi:hypothetical protein